VDEEQPVLEHLLEDQDRPVRLGGQRQRDRGQVRRECRPGAVVDLGDRIPLIVADCQLLLGRHQQVLALDHGLQAEPTEVAADPLPAARAPAGNREPAVGGGGRGMELGDLVVVRGAAWPAPPSFGWPWTVITLEPIPSTFAPILQSSLARSWTWGSQAALPIV